MGEVRGGACVVGGFTRRGVETATGAPAGSLCHLERGVSHFVEGTC